MCIHTVCASTLTGNSQKQHLSKMRYIVGGGQEVVKGSRAGIRSNREMDFTAYLLVEQVLFDAEPLPSFPSSLIDSSNLPILCIIESVQTS